MSSCSNSSLKKKTNDNVWLWRRLPMHVCVFGRRDARCQAPPTFNDTLLFSFSHMQFHNVFFFLFFFPRERSVAFFFFPSFQIQNDTLYPSISARLYCALLLYICMCICAYVYTSISLESMVSVRNRLCEVAHCALPLIGAPMSGYGDVALARAVASVGAVGGVPCSGMAPAQLRELVQDNVGHRLCYNFFCHRPPPASAATLSTPWMGCLEKYFAEEGIDNPAETVQRRIAALRPTYFTAEQLEVLLEVQTGLRGKNAPPLLLSFHFGLPPDALWERLRAVRGPAFCVSCSATTVEEAKYLDERDVDVVVCQGAEAGGHRGTFLPSSRVEQQPGTFALVPQVRAALGSAACLVAAGGVVDAVTARAAVALGADGVQVGTSLLCTAEAKTSAVHRCALREARESGASATSLTNLLSGRPARGLRNRLMAELGSMRDDGPAYPFGPAYLLDLRQKAEADGRGDYSQLWAGQNVSGCTEGSAAAKVTAIAAAFVTT